MEYWHILLRGISLGWLSVLLFKLLARNSRDYTAQVMAATLVCVAAYILRPLFADTQTAAGISSFLAKLIPLFFLLFSEAAFKEHSRPATHTIIIGVIYLISISSGVLLPALGATSLEVAGAFQNLSRLLRVGMMLYALFLMLDQCRADLVESRRWLRMAGFVAVGLYIVAVIIVRISPLSVTASLQMAHSLGILLASVSFVASIILPKHAQLDLIFKVDNDQREISPPKAVTGTRDADSQNIESIMRAMEKEAAYRDHNLTLKIFSQQLAISEHRLRDCINRHLGYRNFNTFLNHYRILDAAQKLRDPGQNHTPILSLAIDAGYRSMTTFNKVFKALHGVTPSEYRQQQQKIENI